jgi:hypothetical protein
VFIPAAAVRCSQLATDPANGLAGNSSVKSATSRVVAASGGNVSFCQVDILFGTNAAQNINIRVGLPLSAADGGTGGVQGAWNGRTQGIGGRGCSGSLAVNAPVNAGYVGSGTDTGHSGGNCETGVNGNGTYNLQFIQDFIRNAIKQQIYNGNGNTNDATNFHCGGNLEQPAVVCADVLAQYKSEVAGTRDTAGSGVPAGTCPGL